MTSEVATSHRTVFATKTAWPLEDLNLSVTETMSRNYYPRTTIRWDMRYRHKFVDFDVSGLVSLDGLAPAEMVGSKDRIEPTTCMFNIKISVNLNPSWDKPHIIDDTPALLSCGVFFAGAVVTVILHGAIFPATP